MPREESLDESSHLVKRGPGRLISAPSSSTVRTVGIATSALGAGTAAEFLVAHPAVVHAAAGALSSDSLTIGLLGGTAIVGAAVSRKYASPHTQTELSGILRRQGGIFMPMGAAAVTVAGGLAAASDLGAHVAANSMVPGATALGVTWLGIGAVYRAASRGAKGHQARIGTEGLGE